MNCPECMETVECADGAGAAICTKCGTEFDPASDAERLRRKNEQVDLSLIDIERDAEGVGITTPWKTSHFMLFFAFFWCLASMLFAFGLTEPTDHLPERRQGGTGAILLFLAFPPIGFASAYIALAFWLNKTTVLVRGRTVSVSCFPIPWLGVEKSFDRADIRQLFVAKYASHGEKRGGERRIVYKYKVVAQGHDGSAVDLCDGADTYARAVSIEAALEDALGMRDEVVPDEHRE
jgi:hypothetical protein